MLAASFEVTFSCAQVTQSIPFPYRVPVLLMLQWWMGVRKRTSGAWHQGADISGTTLCRCGYACIVCVNCYVVKEPYSEYSFAHKYRKCTEQIKLMIHARRHTYRVGASSYLPGVFFWERSPQHKDAACSPKQTRERARAPI